MTTMHIVWASFSILVIIFHIINKIRPFVDPWMNEDTEEGKEWNQKLREADEKRWHWHILTSFLTIVAGPFGFCLIFGLIVGHSMSRLMEERRALVQVNFIRKEWMKTIVEMDELKEYMHSYMEENEKLSAEYENQKNPLDNG